MKGTVKDDKLIIGPFIEVVKTEGDLDLQGENHFGYAKFEMPGRHTREMTSRYLKM